MVEIYAVKKSRLSCQCRATVRCVGAVATCGLYSRHCGIYCPRPISRLFDVSALMRFSRTSSLGKPFQLGKVFRRGKLCGRCFHPGCAHVTATRQMQTGR